MILDDIARLVLAPKQLKGSYVHPYGTYRDTIQLSTAAVLYLLQSLPSFHCQVATGTMGSGSMSRDSEEDEDEMDEGVEKHEHDAAAKGGQIEREMEGDIERTVCSRGDAAVWFPRPCLFTCVT